MDGETPVTHVVRVTRPRPHVGMIRIDRPEQRNALNLTVKRAIVDALNLLEQASDVRVIVITGGPTVFVAGTDIVEMRDMIPASHQAQGTGLLFERIRGCTKPLIAAVEGFALGGGCELALACDMVVAGRTAVFGQPEIRVGIMPGGGGSQLLLRAAGRHRATHLCLTGDRFDAESAMAMGLVSEIVDAGDSDQAACDLAERVAQMPPLAVRAIRDAIRVGSDAPLTAALAYERRAFEALFATDDQVEGMNAFVEKRAPNFKGC